MKILSVYWFLYTLRAYLNARLKYRRLFIYWIGFLYMSGICWSRRKVHHNKKLTERNYWIWWCKEPFKLYRRQGREPDKQYKCFVCFPCIFGHIRFGVWNDVMCGSKINSTDRDEKNLSHSHNYFLFYCLAHQLHHQKQSDSCFS